MINNRLSVDLDSFLKTYYSFEKERSTVSDYVSIRGPICIVDNTGKIWGTFDVLILINESEYPYTVPIVIEKSSVINRDWDYHISEKGECCLDIPHKLQRRKNRGIVIEEFYQEVIYPFFANYFYREATGKYANGEYKHHFAGIAQFYLEEYNLIDFNQIIALLQVAIYSIKLEPNKKCRFCGGPKYKKCCRKKIYQLRENGQQRMKKDLELFTLFNV